VTDPKSVFYGTKENWAPSGQNYYLWINTTSNKYIDQFNAATDEATKKAAIDKFQEVVYEEVPCLDVVNPREIVLTQKNLKYVDPIVFPYPEYFQGPDDSVTLIVPSEKTDLNPLLSTAWYDTVIWTPAFSGLVSFYPSFTANGEPKITQPDLTYVPNKVDLYAAESYTVSSDKLTWTFKLRDGLMFQDGVPVTADDVVFTYRSILTPALASPAYGDYSTVFGSNGSITALDSRTVQFKLPAPMPTFFAQYCGVSILPKHVLENIPYDTWRTHSYNTAKEHTLQMARHSRVLSVLDHTSS
jgi:ABC-type transport system substrate-binding protein